VISVYVEGDDDVPFVEKVCHHVGLEIRAPVLARGGKAEIDKLLPNLARAAKGMPILVLRDLDRDADCAPTWLSKRMPSGAGPYFALRLAVRAIESWVLADVEAASKGLHLEPNLIPAAPDALDDPKVTLVNLARRSRKPAVVNALVPKEGAQRRTGIGYDRWVIAFGVKDWSVERAMKRSPSLARSVAALKRMRRTLQKAGMT
jgi:hypothetical protein